MTQAVDKVRWSEDRQSVRVDDAEWARVDISTPHGGNLFAPNMTIYSAGHFIASLDGHIIMGKPNGRIAFTLPRAAAELWAEAASRIDDAIVSIVPAEPYAGLGSAEHYAPFAIGAWATGQAVWFPNANASPARVPTRVPTGVITTGEYLAVTQAMANYMPEYSNHSGYYFCQFCEAQRREEPPYNLDIGGWRAWITHTTDCPVVKARALLKRHEQVLMRHEQAMAIVRVVAEASDYDAEDDGGYAPYYRVTISSDQDVREQARALLPAPSTQAARLAEQAEQIKRRIREKPDKGVFELTDLE